MGILNTQEVRPGIIALLCKFLLTCDNFTEEKSKIISLLAPDGIAGEDGNKSGSEQIRKTINEAESIGIVTSHEDSVKLNDSFSKWDGNTNKDFVDIIRKQILNESVNTKVSETWASQLGARELTNAIAWYNTIPFHSLKKDNKEIVKLQSASFGSQSPFQETDSDGKTTDISTWPLTRNERLPAFKNWCVFLGFGWFGPKNDVLIPDPTIAIESVLRNIFEEEKELSAKKFRIRLGNSLPVLEGGKYLKLVEANYSEEKSDAVENNTIDFSQATSFALLTLQERKLVKFDSVADGSSGSLKLFNNNSFSSVNYQGKSK